MSTTTTAESTSPVRTIRQRRGYTGERLAALSGVSRGWIGFIERNPEALTLNVAAKLAAALEVKPEDLMPEVAR